MQLALNLPRSLSSILLAGAAVLLMGAEDGCGGNKGGSDEQADDDLGDDDDDDDDDQHPAGTCTGTVVLNAEETEVTGMDLAYLTRFDDDDPCHMPKAGHRYLYVGCHPAETDWYSIGMTLRYLEPGVFDDIERHASHFTVYVNHSINDANYYELGKADPADIQSFQLNVHEADHDNGVFRFDIQATYKVAEGNSGEGTLADVEVSASFDLTDVPQCSWDR